MDFTIGRNIEKFKLTFLAEKSTNIVLEYIKRCRIATFGGYVLNLNYWAEKSTNIVLEYTKRCGIATLGGYVTYECYIPTQMLLFRIF